MARGISRFPSTVFDSFVVFTGTELSILALLLAIGGAIAFYRLN